MISVVISMCIFLRHDVQDDQTAAYRGLEVWLFHNA